MCKKDANTIHTRWNIAAKNILIHGQSEFFGDIQRHRLFNLDNIRHKSLFSEIMKKPAPALTGAGMR